MVWVTLTRGEIVKGMSSGIEARVKEWDTDTRILKISNVGIGTTQRAFIPGETIQATESTFFSVGLTTAAVIGITTTIITGINTSGINLNQVLGSSIIRTNSRNRIWCNCYKHWCRYESP